MRIVGESVFLITREEGYRDDWDMWVPGREIRREIPGCVIIPKGQEVTQGDNYMLASKDVSVLAPVFLEDVKDGDEIEIRGRSYIVSAPPFHHRSAFGTSRGGTEIPAEWRETT